MAKRECVAALATPPAFTGSCLFSSEAWTLGEPLRLTAPMFIIEGVNHRRFCRVP